MELYPHPCMMELQPWEAPTVIDIDVAGETWGGCYEFFTETVLMPGCYRPFS